MKKLHERAALIRAVRFFFEQNGYLEVETPVRNPVLIPEWTIRPVAAEGSFLQTSPELCMKRLLAQGYGKIFQICKCFRGGERGTRHLPEFTLLEWYRAHGEYQSLMRETVALLQAVATAMSDVRGIDPRIVTLLQQQPQYVTVRDAFITYTDQTAEQAIAADCFDEVLVAEIEPKLGFKQPCFLYDYPVALGSLARKKEGDDSLAERFELYVKGMELANGFSELIDVCEQEERFKAELVNIEQAEQRSAMLPEKFLQDLQLMPDACGIALGMDRLCMLLTGATAIAEVVSFTPEEL